MRKMIPFNIRFSSLNRISLPNIGDSFSNAGVLLYAVLFGLGGGLLLILSDSRLVILWLNFFDIFLFVGDISWCETFSPKWLLPLLLSWGILEVCFGDNTVGVYLASSGGVGEVVGEACLELCLEPMGLNPRPLKGLELLVGAVWKPESVSPIIAKAWFLCRLVPGVNLKEKKNYFGHEYCGVFILRQCIKISIWIFWTLSCKGFLRIVQNYSVLFTTFCMTHLGTTSTIDLNLKTREKFNPSHCVKDNKLLLYNFIIILNLPY